MTGFNRCAPDGFCVVLLSQREDNYKCRRELFLIGLTTFRSYTNVFSGSCSRDKEPEARHVQV